MATAAVISGSAIAETLRALEGSTPAQAKAILAASHPVVVIDVPDGWQPEGVDLDLVGV